MKVNTEMLKEIIKELLSERNLQIVDMYGQADKENKDADDFDPQELALGIEVEKEHTGDPEVAKEISTDHLTEFDNYYTALSEMEDELSTEKIESDELAKWDEVPDYEDFINPYGADEYGEKWNEYAGEEIEESVEDVVSILVEAGEVDPEFESYLEGICALNSVETVSELVDTLQPDYVFGIVKTAERIIENGGSDFIDESGFEEEVQLDKTRFIAELNDPEFDDDMDVNEMALITDNDTGEIIEIYLGGTQAIDWSMQDLPRDFFDIYGEEDLIGIQDAIDSVWVDEFEDEEIEEDTAIQAATKVKTMDPSVKKEVKDLKNNKASQTLTSGQKKIAQDQVMQGSDDQKSIEKAKKQPNTVVKEYEKIDQAMAGASDEDKDIAKNMILQEGTEYDDFISEAAAEIYAIIPSNLPDPKVDSITRDKFRELYPEIDDSETENEIVDLVRTMHYEQWEK